MSSMTDIALARCPSAEGRPTMCICGCSFNSSLKPRDAVLERTRRWMIDDGTLPRSPSAPAIALAARRPPCTLSLATCETILPLRAAMSTVKTGCRARSGPARCGPTALESHGARRIAETRSATKSSICAACCRDPSRTPRRRCRSRAACGFFAQTAFELLEKRVRLE